MARTLILELSDQTYAALQQQAQALGKPPEEVAATSLEQRYREQPDPSLPVDPAREVEPQAARQRFRRQAGAVSLGYPTGSDNAAIDADLAREYADNHEEGR